jgi:hypothetical protein
MTRAAAHQLLDELSDDDLDQVTLFIAYRHDRLVVQSLLAPEVERESDETPLSEEEIRAARPGEEVFAELGLI